MYIPFYKRWWFEWLSNWMLSCMWFGREYECARCGRPICKGQQRFAQVGCPAPKGRLLPVLIPIHMFCLEKYGTVVENKDETS